jgi:curli biogenesis system outer membrane secretion channel CsgG
MPRCGRFLNLLLPLALGACAVHYGFSQGTFPPDIKTMAVLPLDNSTASPDVQRELFDAMRNQLDKRLGVRDAPEARADAVVSGTITTYEADVPVSYSANPNEAVSARRKLQITLDIQIVDQKTGKTLWSQKGLTGSGEYAERAEADGRKEAIQHIIDAIIEGAQSQW